MSSRHTFATIRKVRGHSPALVASETVVANPGDGGCNPLTLCGDRVAAHELMEAISERLREYSSPGVVRVDGRGRAKGDLHGSAPLRYLLLEDVQRLALSSGGQQTIIEILDHCLSRGSQVVLACDRDPDAVPGFSYQLLRRIHAGVVVPVRA